MAHAIFTARAKSRSRVASLCAFFGRQLWRCQAPVAAWRRRRHDRQWLEHLNERELRDLGIDHAFVENESAIPFWSLQISRHTML